MLWIFFFLSTQKIICILCLLAQVRDSDSCRVHVSEVFLTLFLFFLGFLCCQQDHSDFHLSVKASHAEGKRPVLQREVEKENGMGKMVGKKRVERGERRGFWSWQRWCVSVCLGGGVYVCVCVCVFGFV